MKQTWLGRSFDVTLIHRMCDTFAIVSCIRDNRFSDIGTTCVHQFLSQTLPRITTLHDWLKKLAPLFHPISKTVKTKTNHDAFAHVFPRLASAACIYVEF